MRKCTYLLACLLYSRHIAHCLQVELEIWSALGELLLQHQGQESRIGRYLHMKDGHQWQRNKVCARPCARARMCVCMCVCV